MTGAPRAAARKFAESSQSVAGIASTAAGRPTISVVKAVAACGRTARAGRNGSRHGIGRTVPVYATGGVSRPPGETPGDSQAAPRYTGDSSGETRHDRPRHLCLERPGHAGPPLLG